MIFSDLNFSKETPKYIQLVAYIKTRIKDGTYKPNAKLPSTRELSQRISISRSTIVNAYELLESDGTIYAIPGKGFFVSPYSNGFTPDFPDQKNRQESAKKINWEGYISKKAILCKEMDLIKNELPWKKDIISFTSIAPDESLFDTENVKKSFLQIYDLEDKHLLGYGYAKGYQPLLDYLFDYMKGLGVDMSEKDILVTNGFTEGFQIILQVLTENEDIILCENPTHHTAIKIMKSNDLHIEGIDMTEKGIDISMLENKIQEHEPKFIYLIPSYHNPTGITLSPKKRLQIVNLCSKYGLPIIEDGFNEELRFESSHGSPLISYAKDTNSIIYIGSFSKILMPGLRLGWIVADKKIIDYAESIKRTFTIHTSFLDQGILYQYIKEGYFNRYLKRIRGLYKDKYEYALGCIRKYIDYDRIYSQSGLHLFVTLNGVNTRDLLDLCYRRGVLFLPGDIFYVGKKPSNTLRLGISRVSFNEINTGFKIIGQCIKEIKESKRKG